MNHDAKPIMGGIGIDRLHCKDGTCIHCYGKEVPFSQFWNYIDSVAYDNEQCEIRQE